MSRIGVWLALACFGLATAGIAGEAGVPVTKVTAFSSGVAYFEHNGKVTGDTEIVLKFKTDQINDLLKSLVVLDLGGGEVAGVNYASRDPLTRALKSFGVDISGEPTLGQLLKQVRGADVIVSAPEKITGKVIGVETRTRQILPGNTLVHQEYLTLLTAEGIKSIALDTVASITLADEKLNGELGKALALLVESRDANSKPVQINFTGKGERQVRIGYISEAPVWRTSYRLILGEDAKKEEGSLQGWAIVENTSDFDWEKVDLTLVSGRPISFIMDLYTALYVPRPVVQPELYASLRPQQYDEGLKEEKAIALRASDARANAAWAAAPPPAPGLAGGRRSEAARSAASEMDRAGAVEYQEALQRGVGSAATAKAVGELFSYRIKAPVTLQRRKSAMLPIVNQTVKARKVSIYNQVALATNPLNGFWLHNDTGLSLLAGPVTIFDGGTYAGDAQIGNLSPAEKRLLSYAIDLKVTVDPSATQSQQIVAAKIVRGVLQYSRKHQFNQTYLIKNKADQERTVLVEHPIVANRKLVEPAEPLEKTPQVYRFETKVPAGITGKFPVREELVEGQSIEIMPCDIGQLQVYSTNGEIPAKVREALTEAIVRKQALTTAQRELGELEQRVQTLRKEQADVRANLGPLDRNSTSFQRFEKKVLDIETQIETVQKQIADKRAGVNTARGAFEEYLGKLSVE